MFPNDQDKLPTEFQIPRSEFVEVTEKIEIKEQVIGNSTVIDRTDSIRLDILRAYESNQAKDDREKQIARLHNIGNDLYRARQDYLNGKNAA